MNLTPLTIVLVFGLIIGVAGHIVRSRTMIVTGILLIGFVSVYFGFFVAKVR
jgi:hypothetical protein